MKNHKYQKLVNEVTDWQPAGSPAQFEQWLRAEVLAKLSSKGRKRFLAKEEMNGPLEGKRLESYARGLGIKFDANK